MHLTPKLRRLAWLLVTLYIAVLLKAVLFKYPSFEPLAQSMTLDRLLFRLQQANFTPFKTIAYYLSGHANTNIAVMNIGGNIFLFSPLGFLVPVILPRVSRVWAVTAITFWTSLLLELTQLLTGLGGFDVDDLLLNTAGGLVGVLAFRVASRLFHVTPSLLENSR